MPEQRAAKAGAAQSVGTVVGARGKRALCSRTREAAEGQICNWTHSPEPGGTKKGPQIEIPSSEEEDLSRIREVCSRPHIMQVRPLKCG